MAARMLCGAAALVGLATRCPTGGIRPGASRPGIANILTSPFYTAKEKQS